MSLFLSPQVTAMMTRRVARSAFHPVTTTSCISSPCSGRFCSPASRPQSTGTAGPVSWSPSASSASSPPSSEIWRHTSAAPWGCGTPWPPWCSWLWELLFQVREVFLCFCVFVFLCFCVSSYLFSVHLFCLFVFPLRPPGESNPDNPDNH